MSATKPEGRGEALERVHSGVRCFFGVSGSILRYDLLLELVRLKKFIRTIISYAILCTHLNTVSNVLLHLC